MPGEALRELLDSNIGTITNLDETDAEISGQ